MRVEEREKLFTTIARRGFEKDLYTHDEVFDDIRRSPFSLKEAAEYLDVAEITFNNADESKGILSEIERFNRCSSPCGRG
jgi:hypothetical protein